VFNELIHKVDFVRQPGNDLQSLPPDPNDLCHLMPTGGTTDLPKLVPRTHNDFYCNPGGVNRRASPGGPSSCRWYAGSGPRGTGLRLRQTKNVGNRYFRRPDLLPESQKHFRALSAGTPGNHLGDPFDSGRENGQKTAPGGNQKKNRKRMGRGQSITPESSDPGQRTNQEKGHSVLPAYPASRIPGP